MSKAEKFIQDCTRNCSNEFDPQKAPPSVYNPWLTPDQARKAVEIAREETLLEVAAWINATLLVLTRTNSSLHTVHCLTENRTKQTRYNNK